MAITDDEAEALLVAALRRRPRRAAFAAEVGVELERSGVGREQAEQALATLESGRRVLVRPHYCADPHLAAIDLRVVALVEEDVEKDGGGGVDPIGDAVERVERTWRDWEAEFLANHRCT